MDSPAGAASDLLTWYDRHRRDLPWRRTADPYSIWVSEVMLQQTRVETVLPYYAAFLARFPTVEDLARAEVDEVLPLWSGLGYYRRCRQMHLAAREIVRHGAFPATVDGLRKLPGIGEYTAAAVASIAFGVRVPVLDGNVERVVARQLALEGDSRSRAARGRILARAGDLLDPARPGDSNQALMELGATICSSRSPRCLLCPIASGCRALAEGSPERFPAVRPRKTPVARRLVVAVVEADRRWLLFRRPDESDLLAGTWELPWVEVGREDSVAVVPAQLAAKYGGGWRLGESLATVRHGITFRTLSVEVFAGRVEPGGFLADGPRAEWFSPEERRRLASSSLLSKIEKAVAADPVRPILVRSRRPRA